MARSVALLADSRSEIGANRLRAMVRYAEAMGWTVRVYEPSQLGDAIAGRSVDLVLCWRLAEIPDIDTLYATCNGHDVDILPVAQSCSALAE